MGNHIGKLLIPQRQPIAQQLRRQQQKMFIGSCGCCVPVTTCDHCVSSNPALTGWSVNVTGIISVPFSSDDLHPGDCDPNPPRTCTYDVSGAEGDWFVADFAPCSWSFSQTDIFTGSCEGCGLAPSENSYSFSISIIYSTSFPGSPSYPWWMSMGTGTTTAQYRAADADCSGAITFSKYAENIKGTIGAEFPASCVASPVT